MCSQQPSDYQHTTYQVTTDIEELYQRSIPTCQPTTKRHIEAFFRYLDQIGLPDNPKKNWLIQELREWVRQHRVGDFPNKRILLSIYHDMIDNGFRFQHNWKPYLTLKSAKSESGVLVVTVVTSPTPTVNGRPQKFSCQWNCYYCPNEPGQPRSYLHDEPSVLRANMNGFDPILQFTDRLLSLVYNGHPADKIELLVLGGTWSSYPLEYRETFIRDLFYAANTFRLNTHETETRDRLTLSEEKTRNETARCKIIGVTLETRPDCIDDKEVLHFRRVGATRIQLGIQQTDNGVLRKINRECTAAQAKLGIQRLKQCGFKVDIHLMTQLPGADVELDRKMFREVLTDPDWQADQWKIYPCETTPWTVIQIWHQQGKYTPYSDKLLTELLLWLKPQVHPWIRLNRIVRDIPSQYIFGGTKISHLRQLLHHRLAELGQCCQCIRCREVGRCKPGVDYLPENIKRSIKSYDASGGKEYFISYEVPPCVKRVGKSDTYLLGFIRLRINTEPECWAYQVFPKLRGTALIRELHVYGQVVPVNMNRSADGSPILATQHTGLGRRLVADAENIAREYCCRQIAVISGVGVRNFYRKLHYRLIPNEPSELLYKSLGVKQVLDNYHQVRRYLGIAMIVLAMWITWYYQY